MKIIFIAIIFFIIIFPQRTYSSSEIDSLKSEIQKAETPIEQLNLTLQLVEIMVNSDNAETPEYLELAEKISAEMPDNDKKALLKKYFAKYYIFIGEYEKAAECYLSAIKIAEEQGDVDTKKKSLNGLAILNMRTKNFEQGIEIFKQLLDFAKAEKNSEDINYYSINLAMAYGEIGDYEKSKNVLLNVYKYESVKQFFKAVAANILSFIFNNQQNYKEALKYAKEAAEISKNSTDMAFKIENLTNYSNALMGQGKTGEARKIIKEIISISQKNNFIRKMNNAIGNLALNYESAGDYKLALKYYKDFSERRDSLLNETTTSQINELQIKYETEKKDKEITEKNASIREKNLILYYTFGGGVVFILISVVIFIFYRKKNAAYKELVKKNLEIIKSEKIYAERMRRQRNEEKIKYGSSSLSEDKKEELHAKLLEVINEEKVFLQQEITLGKLAQKLNVNSKYLSQTIHEIYNLGFSDFINQLRIKEAAKLLNDKSFRHISIEGISELVGFHAKSSFNTNFKKYMGVTPSFFSRTSSEISE